MKTKDKIILVMGIIIILFTVVYLKEWITENNAAKEIEERQELLNLFVNETAIVTSQTCQPISVTSEQNNQITCIDTRCLEANK